MELFGEAMEQAGPVNVLKFYSSFEQTYLLLSIELLKNYAMNIQNVAPYTNHRSHSLAFVRIQTLRLP